MRNSAYKRYDFLARVPACALARMRRRDSAKDSRQFRLVEMSTSASEICEIARPFAADIWLSVGQAVQITLCLTTLVLAPFSLSKRKWRKVPVHSNIKVCVSGVRTFLDRSRSRSR